MWENSLRIDKSNTYNCEDCYERSNQANDIAEDLSIEFAAIFEIGKY